MNAVDTREDGTLVNLEDDVIVILIQAVENSTERSGGWVDQIFLVDVWGVGEQKLTSWASNTSTSWGNSVSTSGDSLNLTGAENSTSTSSTDGDSDDARED